MAIIDRSQTILRAGIMPDLNTLPTTWKQRRLRPGESLEPTHGMVEDDSFNPSGFAEDPILGAIATEGLTLPVTGSPEEDALWLASFLGAVAQTQIGASGAHRATITPVAPGVAPVARPLAGQIERGDGRVLTLLEAYIDSIQVAMSDGAGQLQYTLRSARAKDIGEATWVTGTGDLPQVRGYLSKGAREALKADLDGGGDGLLYVKVITAGPNPTVEVKLGSGAAYAGTSTNTITDGQWSELKNNQATPAGVDFLGQTPDDSMRPADGDRVELFVADASGWQIGDELTIPPTGVRWTVALPVKHPLSQVYSLVEFDSEVFVAQEFTLTINRPFAQPTALGGRFNTEVLQRGILGGSISFSRQQRDQKLVNIVQSKRPFALGITLGTGHLVDAGDAATERKIDFILPKLRGTGGTAPTSSSADNADESLEVGLYPDGGSPPVTIDVVTSQSDILA